MLEINKSNNIIHVLYAAKNFDTGETVTGKLYNELNEWSGRTGINITGSDSGGSLLLTSGAAHGFVADDKLIFTTTGTLPGGLSIATTYYVISAGLTTTTFEVSATKGGSAIAWVDAGSGTHTAKLLYFNAATAYDLSFVSNGDGTYSAEFIPQNLRKQTDDSVLASTQYLGDWRIVISEGASSTAASYFKITIHDIESVGTALADGTTGLAAIKTAVNTVDTVVDGIQADLDNPTDGLSALKSLIDSLQGSVSSIQNNTLTSVSVPTEFNIPEDYQKVYKIYVNTYNQAGASTDVDSDDIQLIVTDETGDVLDETWAGTGITVGGVVDNTQANLGNYHTVNGIKYLKKETTGRYSFTVTIESTATNNTNLNIDINYLIATATRNVDRLISVKTEPTVTIEAGGYVA